MTTLNTQKVSYTLVSFENVVQYLVDMCKAKFPQCEHEERFGSYECEFTDTNIYIDIYFGGNYCDKCAEHIDSWCNLDLDPYRANREGQNTTVCIDLDSVNKIIAATLPMEQLKYDHMTDTGIYFIEKQGE